MLKFLILAIALVACDKDDDKKTVYVETEKLMGYACTYSEELTAKLFEGEKLKEGHSFCYQPSKDFNSSVQSCREAGGLVGVVCQSNPDVTCDETPEGQTLFYGPNWTLEFCPEAE